MRDTSDELVSAILQNKCDDVAAAIAAGADVNQSVRGSRPLFHAVVQARPAIVELLLRHGADWKERDDGTGNTPLMMATINAAMRPWKNFSARAIKDSQRVVEMLTAAGATDEETQLVLGNESDEAGLIVEATGRKLRGDERVLSANGVLILLPPRLAKKLGAARFDTIALHARRTGLRRLGELLAT